MFRTKGTNLLRAKTHNHSVVLEIIRLQGPVSRTAISSQTELSRQTVQNIVAELIEDGIVSLSAGEKKGRGNPGMLVQWCPGKAFSIGIQVDQFNVTAVACDLSGKQIWTDSRRLEQRSVEDANLHVLTLVEKFRHCCPDSADKVLGIGVAAPGPFGEQVSGKTEATAFSEFGCSDNIAMLSDKTGLPVTLENDATAAALGEYFYGKGKGLNSFVLLHFGLGFGAGFMLDGNLYRGVNSNAGELGHIVIEHGGRQCHCGKQGCLERYLSICALCEALQLSPRDASSIDKIEQLFKANDARVLAWIEANAIYLERVIDIVKSTLDAEMIFIGGVVSAELVDAILQSCIRQSGSVLVAKDSFDNVFTAASGPITVALGASAAVSSEILAPSLAKMLL
ncbi:MAG: ROK family transcriptional regulator [Oceanospirillaceae bacterium]|nr:ROK family transcriptional regulator [Oceanospirillaceae bacterium]